MVAGIVIDIARGGSAFGQEGRSEQRVGTLRARVRAWNKCRTWFRLTHGLGHPSEPLHVIDYLLDRRAEPCTRGVLSSIVDRVRFVEKNKGLEIQQTVTEVDFVLRSPRNRSCSPRKCVTGWGREGQRTCRRFGALVDWRMSWSAKIATRTIEGLRGGS